MRQRAVARKVTAPEAQVLKSTPPNSDDNREIRGATRVSRGAGHAKCVERVGLAAIKCRLCDTIWRLPLKNLRCHSNLYDPSVSPKETADVPRGAIK